MRYWVWCIRNLIGRRRGNISCDGTRDRGRQFPSIFDANQLGRPSAKAGCPAACWKPWPTAEPRPCTPFERAQIVAGNDEQREARFCRRDFVLLRFRRSDVPVGDLPASRVKLVVEPLLLRERQVGNLFIHRAQFVVQP